LARLDVNNKSDRQSYSLLKLGFTVSSGAASVAAGGPAGAESVPETSLMAVNSLSMKDSSRTFLSSLVKDSWLSLSVALSVLLSLVVVRSLILKLVVVVVVVVVVVAASAVVVVTVVVVAVVVVVIVVVVVVVGAVVVDVVGQSGLSGHSRVSVWSPWQGSPSPMASWTMNLDRVWSPPGPQVRLQRLQRLSSDHRQSTAWSVQSDF